MHNELLRDLVVIFAVAVAIVGVLRKINVPSIAGFILAGVLVGPNVLRIVSDVAEVEVLAEIGVALLLFGIGIELSLDRVRRLWRVVVAGGLIQVVVTGGATVGILLSLGFDPSISFLFGCVIAISSTAVVLSSLRSRGELEAPHGRFALSILIFQDLCVVPMILIIPLMAGTAEPGALAIAVAKAAAVLAAALVGARLVVPRLFALVAHTRQRDLFVLTVFLVCIGTAWLVSAAGVSLALGAFLAGLVVASSEYRHQALSDMIPFREVFASLFFVSVGMLLDPRAIADNALPIVAIIAAIVLGKAVIAALTGAVVGLSFRISVLAGLALAQVGEFSFVLLSAGRDAFALPHPFAENVTVAIVVTMLITPLIISLAPKVAAGMGKVDIFTRRLQVQTPADRSEGARVLRNHVIIAGYGLTGEELAQSLDNCSVPCLIVDVNPTNVRRAIQDGREAYFGDVTSAEVLEALGAHGARELVLVINDIEATVRAIRAARQLSRSLPVFVRTQYALDIHRVVEAGATEVITGELEASVTMTKRILERCAVTAAAVEPEVERIRERREEETRVN